MPTDDLPPKPVAAIEGRACRIPIVDTLFLAAIVGSILLVIACTSGSSPGVSADTSFLGNPQSASVVFLGNLADRSITEASGMATSGRRKDLLWIINDGGNAPLIHAVGLDGSDHGRCRIRNAHNRDWEDLAGFSHDGKPYLLIADCGDNDSRRRSCTLYVVEEPRVDPSGLPEGCSIPWQWRIDYSYVGGPRDCEGVAVDMDSRQILLLTKRVVPPVIYSVPLFPSSTRETELARPLAAVSGIPAPDAEDLKEDPLYGRFRSQPTAMDISPKGDRVAVLTYKRPYLYPRREDQDWPQVFAAPPVPLTMPRLRQAEAMCFSADGSSLYITSEMLPAPLIRLDIAP